MTKKVFLLGVFAAMVSVALVLTFCSKQAETGSRNDVHNVKIRKGPLVPCDFNKRNISPKIALGISGYCIYVSIVCCNCLIDGEYYISKCEPSSGGEASTGIFHVENHGENWVEGCPGAHFNDLPSGVTVDDILGILADPWFAPCCM